MAVNLKGAKNAAVAVRCRQPSAARVLWAGHTWGLGRQLHTLCPALAPASHD